MKRIINVLFLLLFALACNEHSTDTTKTDENVKKIEMQNIQLSVPQDVKDEDILGRIFISKDIFFSNNSYSTQEAIFGNFWIRSKDWNVDAGDIYLNGNLIDKASMYVGESNQDSAYTYDDSVPVNLDGRPYIVDISGSSDYPVCSITIDSPSGEVELTNISNGITINSNQDLSINWTCSSDTTTQIGIILFSDDGNPGTSVYSFDDGNEVISSSVLSSLIPGSYTLCATSYKYNLIPVNSTDYLLGVVMFKKEYQVNIN